MEFFKTEKKIVNDNREIIESLYDTKLCYQVVFIQTFRYNVYLFGKLIHTYTKTEKDIDKIFFKDLIVAEWYAKNMRRKSGYNSLQSENYMDYEIYFIGDEAISKYGHFKFNNLDHGAMRNERFFIEFHFYHKYEYIYGNRIKINDVMNRGIESYSASDCINYVLRQCNNFKKDKKVVRTFNVVTIENVPVDELNVSTKEIEQLKHLVEQFHKDQESYAELTKKLLSK